MLDPDRILATGERDSTLEGTVGRRPSFSGRGELRWVCGICGSGRLVSGSAGEISEGGAAGNLKL